MITSWALFFFAWIALTIIERQKGDNMGEWNNDNIINLEYKDKNDNLSMHLMIRTKDRRVNRDDIERVIEYLKEKKYDFGII